MEDPLACLYSYLTYFEEVEPTVTMDEIPYFQDLVSSLNKVVNGGEDSISNCDINVFEVAVPRIIRLFLAAKVDDSNSPGCENDLVDALSGLMAHLTTIKSIELINAISDFVANYVALMIDRYPKAVGEELLGHFENKFFSDEIVNCLILSISHYSYVVTDNWDRELLSYYNLVSSYVVVKNCGYGQFTDVQSLTELAENLDVTVQFTELTDITNMESHVNRVFDFLNALADKANEWNAFTTPSGKQSLGFYFKFDQFVDNLAVFPDSTDMMKMMLVNLTTKLCSYIYSIISDVNAPAAVRMFFGELTSACEKTIKTVFNKMFDGELGKEFVNEYNAILDFIVRHCDPRDIYEKIIQMSGDLDPSGEEKEKENNNQPTQIGLRRPNRDRENEAEGDSTCINKTTLMSKLEKVNHFLDKVSWMEDRDILFLCNNVNPFEKMNALTFRILVEIGKVIYKPIASTNKQLIAATQALGLTKETSFFEDRMEIEMLGETKKNTDTLRGIFFSLILLACGITPHWDTIKAIEGNEEGTNKIMRRTSNSFPRITLDPKTTSTIRKSLLKKMDNMPMELKTEAFRLITGIIRMGTCLRFCFRYLKKHCSEDNMPLSGAHMLGVELDTSTEIVSAVYNAVSANLKASDNQSIDMDILEAYCDMFPAFFKGVGDITGEEFGKVDSLVVKVCFANGSNSFERLNLLIFKMENDKSGCLISRCIQCFAKETQTLFRSGGKVGTDKSTLENLLSIVNSTIWGTQNADSINVSTVIPPVYTDKKFQSLFTSFVKDSKDSRLSNPAMYIMMNFVVPVGFVFFPFRERTSPKSPDAKDTIRLLDKFIDTMKDWIYIIYRDETLMRNVSQLIECLLAVIFAIWDSMTSRFSRHSSFDDKREFSINQISFGLTWVTRMINMVVPVLCYNSFHMGVRDGTARTENIVTALTTVSVCSGFVQGQLSIRTDRHKLVIKDKGNVGSQIIKEILKHNEYNIGKGKRRLQDCFSNIAIIPSSQSQLYDPFMTFDSFSNSFAVYSISNSRAHNAVMLWLFNPADTNSRDSFFNIINNLLNGDLIKCFNVAMFKLGHLLSVTEFSKGLDGDSCLRFLNTLNKFCLSLPSSPVAYGRLCELVSGMEIWGTGVVLHPSTENTEAFSQFFAKRFQPSEGFMERDRRMGLVRDKGLSFDISDIFLMRLVALELSMMMTLNNSAASLEVGKKASSFLFNILAELDSMRFKLGSGLNRLKRSGTAVSKADARKDELVLTHKLDLISDISDIVYRMIFKASYADIRLPECQLASEDLLYSPRFNSSCNNSLGKPSAKVFENYLGHLAFVSANHSGTKLMVNFSLLEYVLKTFLRGFTLGFALNSRLSKIKVEREIRNYLCSSPQFKNPLLVLHHIAHVLRHVRPMCKTRPDLLGNLREDTLGLCTTDRLIGVVEMEDNVRLLVDGELDVDVGSFMKAYKSVIQLTNSLDPADISKLRPVVGAVFSTIFDIISAKHELSPVYEPDMNPKEHKNMINSIAFLEDSLCYDIQTVFNNIASYKANRKDTKQIHRLAKTTLDDSESNEAESQPETPMPPHLKVTLSVINYFNFLVVSIIKHFEQRRMNSEIKALLENQSDPTPPKIVPCLVYSMKLIRVSITNKLIGVSSDFEKTLLGVTLANCNSLKKFMLTHFVEPKFPKIPKSMIRYNSYTSNILKYHGLTQDFEDANTVLKTSFCSNPTTILSEISPTLKVLVNSIHGKLGPNEYDSGAETSLILFHCLKNEAMLFSFYVLANCVSASSDLGAVRDVHETKAGGHNTRSAQDEFRDTGFLTGQMFDETVNQSNGKYPGLKNVGQTCYINCVLQQLFFNVPFRKSIIKMYKQLEAKGGIGTTKANGMSNQSEQPANGAASSPDGALGSGGATLSVLAEGGNGEDSAANSEGRKIVRVIGKLFVDMEAFTTQAIDTMELCNSLATMKISERVGRQSDAMEFFSNLIDKLYEGAANTDDERGANPFKFRKIETLKLACGHSKHTVNNLFYVQISLILFANKLRSSTGMPIRQDISIQEAINKMTVPVVETDPNDSRFYECIAPGCSGSFKDADGRPKSRLQDTSERISNPPKHLILFIPRIQQDPTNDWDNWVRLKIDKVIDMRLMVEAAQENTNMDHSIYVLSGVVVHMGNDEFGHYVSYCRERQPEEEKLESDPFHEVTLDQLNQMVEESMWYEMNDGNVFHQLQDSIFKAPPRKTSGTSGARVTNQKKGDVDQTQQQTFFGVDERGSPYILFYDKVAATIVSQCSAPEKMLASQTPTEPLENTEDAESWGKESTVEEIKRKCELEDATDYANLYAEFIRDGVTFVTNDGLAWFVANASVQCALSIIGGKVTYAQAGERLLAMATDVLKSTNNLNAIFDIRQFRKQIDLCRLGNIQDKDLKCARLTAKEAYECTSALSDAVIFVLQRFNPTLREGDKFFTRIDRAKMPNILAMLTIGVILLVEHLSDQFPQISELLLRRIGGFRELSELDFTEGYFDTQEENIPDMCTTVIQNWILHRELMYSNTMAIILFTTLANPRERLLGCLNGNDKTLKLGSTPKEMWLAGSISRMNKLTVDLLLTVDIKRFYLHLNSSTAACNILTNLVTFDSDLLCYNTVVSLGAKVCKGASSEATDDAVQSDIVPIIPIIPIFYYLGDLASYFEDILMSVAVEIYIGTCGGESVQKYSTQKQIPIGTAIKGDNASAVGCPFKQLDVVDGPTAEREIYGIYTKLSPAEFPRHSYMRKAVEGVIALCFSVMLYCYYNSSPSDKLISVRSLQTIMVIENRMMQSKFIGGYIYKGLSDTGCTKDPTSPLVELLLLLSYVSESLSSTRAGNTEQNKSLLLYYTPQSFSFLSALGGKPTDMMQGDVLSSHINSDYEVTTGGWIVSSAIQLSTRLLLKEYGTGPVADKPTTNAPDAKMSAHSFPEIGVDYALGKVDVWLLTRQINDNSRTTLFLKGVDVGKARGWLTRSLLNATSAVKISVDFINALLFSIFNYEALHDKSSIEVDYEAISPLLTHNIHVARLTLGVVKDIFASSVPNKTIGTDGATASQYINIVVKSLRDVTIPSSVRELLFSMHDALMTRLAMAGCPMDKFKAIGKTKERVLNSHLNDLSVLNDEDAPFGPFIVKTFPPGHVDARRESDRFSCFMPLYNVAGENKIRCCSTRYQIADHGGKGNGRDPAVIQKCLVSDMLGFMVSCFEANGFDKARGFSDVVGLREIDERLYIDRSMGSCGFYGGEGVSEQAKNEELTPVSPLFSIQELCKPAPIPPVTKGFLASGSAELTTVLYLFLAQESGEYREQDVDIESIPALSNFLCLFDVRAKLMGPLVHRIDDTLNILLTVFDVSTTRWMELVEDIEAFAHLLRIDRQIKPDTAVLGAMLGKRARHPRKFNLALFFHVVLIARSLSMLDNMVEKLARCVMVGGCQIPFPVSSIGLLVETVFSLLSAYKAMQASFPVKEVVDAINRDGTGSFRIMLSTNTVPILAHHALLSIFVILQDISYSSNMGKGCHLLTSGLWDELVEVNPPMLRLFNQLRIPLQRERETIVQLIEAFSDGGLDRIGLTLEKEIFEASYLTEDEKLGDVASVGRILERKTNKLLLLLICSSSVLDSLKPEELRREGALDLVIPVLLFVTGKLIGTRATIDSFDKLVRWTNNIADLWAFRAEENYYGQSPSTPANKTASTMRETQIHNAKLLLGLFVIHSAIQTAALASGERAGEVLSVKTWRKGLLRFCLGDTAKFLINSCCRIKSEIRREMAFSSEASSALVTVLLEETRPKGSRGREGVYVYDESDFISSLCVVLAHTPPDSNLFRCVIEFSGLCNSIHDCVVLCLLNMLKVGGVQFDVRDDERLCLANYIPELAFRMANQTIEEDGVRPKRPPQESAASPTGELLVGADVGDVEMAFELHCTPLDPSLAPSTDPGTGPSTDLSTRPEDPPATDKQ